MKKIVFLTGTVLIFSCQRFHNKTQIIDNSSSDTLELFNSGNGDTELIYPGATYQISFQEKLGSEEEGIICNDVNDNYSISTINGDTLIKSLFDESSWSSTVSGDKDTEQECTFTVTDEDIAS